MSPIDPNQDPNQDPDPSPDWNDDAHAFEQQLSSLQPTPPTQPWNAVAESIHAASEQDTPVASVQQTTSVWRPVISHSITAVAGLAAGVAIMLLQPPSNPGSIGDTGENTNSSTLVELVDSQNSNSTQPAASNRETAFANETTSHRQQRFGNGWRSQRFTQTNFRPGPLRAFGSIDHSLVAGSERHLPASLNDDQRFSHPEDLDTDDTWPDQSADESIDKPVLSPRSLHLFLDDLTHSPTSNKRFLKAEGSSS